MPVNLGITFLIGGILGWIVVRILRPPRHLEGLVIATCSAGNVVFCLCHVPSKQFLLIWSRIPSGNMGNLLWIIIPAICEQDGNPFGNNKVSGARGLASFSMAVEPQISSVSALNAVLVEASDVFCSCRLEESTFGHIPTVS